MKLLHDTSFDWRSWLAGAGLVLCFFFAQVSLAATIMVDDTNCTLESAIISANNDSAPSGSQCTAGSGADILDLTNFTSNSNALFSVASISTNITIEGRGKLVGGAGTSRNFTVTSSGTLTLKNLTVTSGVGTGNILGGGIANMGRTTIIDSVIHSNSSANIFSSGQLVIRGSAIYSGTSAVAGAGLRIIGGSLNISNSTVDNNTPTSGAGGIYIGGGATATFTHVTVWKNSTSNASVASQLEINGAATAVSLRNSIVCDNDTSTTDLLLSGGATLRQNVGNVIGEGDAKTTASCGDLGSRTGSPGYYLPPDNDGALGIGNAAFCKQFSRDQRGLYRPETGCDAGSVERDGFNYIYVDSTCTVRQAIITANNQSSQNQCEVGVEDSVATDVIWLTMDAGVTQTGQIGVSSKILIEGQSHTISRTSGTGRLFLVNSNASFTVRKATISGGNPGGDGGAFNVQGGAGIHLEDCIIKDNHSTSEDGGGIYFHTNHGRSTIDRCYFFTNRAGSEGGALKIAGGTVTVSNSTFVSNNSVLNGGAIAVSGGTATLAHLTLWDNTSNDSGQVTGIHAGGTTNLYNSIIGRASDQGGALCGGTFQGSGEERGIMITQATANCPEATVANPRLGAATGAVPYFPMTAGSPARGKGLDAQCANYPTDQAGKARPATNCDIGAAQYVPPPASAAASGGASDYVAPGSASADEPPVCTGEALNESGAFNVSTTYGLCNGVQFNQLELSAIGIGYVVEAGPLAAVDVWGWVTATVKVCYRGQASALFLDAATAPRTVTPLASTWDGVWTCAQISSAGTIVFLPAQSHLTTPSVDAAAPAAPADAAPLSKCMVTLNFILNFRAAPGGDVIMILPYGIKLTAFQRSGDWVQVDYHGIRGWVSASHVTFEGDC